MKVIELAAHLRPLRLGGMAAVPETRLRQTQAEAMAPIDLISCLLTDELTRRSDRLLERRRKQAGFRDPQKTRQDGAANRLGGNRARAILLAAAAEEERESFGDRDRESLTRTVLGAWPSDEARPERASNSRDRQDPFKVAFHPQLEVARSGDENEQEPTGAASRGAGRPDASATQNLPRESRTTTRTHASHFFTAINPRKEPLLAST